MNKNLRRAQKLLNQSTADTDEIISLLERVLKQSHSPWLANHLMGMALLRKKKYRKAIINFEQAIKKGANDPGTYHFLSKSYFEVQDFEKAELYAMKSVELKENYFKGWMQLGAAYRAQGKLNEGLKCYQKANQINPKSAEVAFRIATIYQDQSKPAKALELFDITIKLDPKYLEAYTGKASILRGQNKLDEAEAILHESLRVNGNFLKAKAELAEISKTRGDYDEALAIYEKLLKAHPNVTGLRVNYALCQLEIGNFEESEKNYLQAFKEDPNILEALSNYLMGLHYNPKRSKEEIFEAHLLWDKQYSADPSPARPIPENREKWKKLRIGLLSGGLRAHPVGWMITLALENLPRDQFEIYAYSTHGNIDFITKRIYERSDAWRPVVGYTEEVIARMIRKDEIDILLELSGHSAGNRLHTINREPAPIIVKWVGGLFNTSGLKAMDFLITDWYETPKGEEEFYTEKLVRMPGDYICFLPPEYATDVEELPALSNEEITFGCFNNPTKINNEILGVWAKIMRQVPKSRLFLKSRQYDTKALRTRIIEQMNECGVTKDRLIFEGASPHVDLLECYNRVDIALDPWPYSGGLTTCEALWMGVPVITKPGPTFAGRHSTTHLINASFPEWVKDTWDEYIATAVSLAKDLKELNKLRQSMREKVSNSPLCDGERFGAHFSIALRKMWEQWVEGYENGERNWQDHIKVEALPQTAPRKKTLENTNDWKTYLQSFPWSESFIEDWERKSELPENANYFKALNNLCRVESLNTENKTKKVSESEHAILMIQSAEKLIDLYNKGRNQIPIAFTLARILSALGKKSEAAEIIEALLTSHTFSNKEWKPNLPFLLPVPLQDSTPVHTDFNSWLTVRTVESLIFMTDSSSWLKDEKIQSLLQGLMDNPETIPELNKIAREMFGSHNRSENGRSINKRKGKFLHFCFNHVYGKTLSDLVEYTNEYSDQEHWLYLEKRNAIDRYNAGIRLNPHSTFFDYTKHMETIIDRSRDENVDGIFIHGLFFDWQKELIRQIADEKHIGWVIWGGDLYDPIKDKKPMNETFQYIDSIHSIVDGDVELFNAMYGERPNYVFGYPYPGLYGELPEVKAEEKKAQIVLGNSGEISNNHIEILKVLAGKTDIHNFDLILPVSYNFLPEYEVALNRWVKKLGLEKRVHFVKRFIAPDEYLQIISRSQMLITAHHRQQAVGNLLASLYSGNNTFLREQIHVDGNDIVNPGWKFLKEHQFQINRFDELKKVKSISDIQPVSRKQQAIHQSIIREKFGLEKRSKELVESCSAIIERKMQTA